MARIFITGSVDGLGQLAANALVHLGHSVVLHARNSQRAEYGLAMVPGAETVLIGDLSSIQETKTWPGWSTGLALLMRSSTTPVYTRPWKIRLAQTDFQ
ncbi:hypothetical protein [Dyadobacter alkalitolerans]|uniref:hypothetical protein n=1 Tax=Dyadobacter alkalitolerans TaxID=492736 RepID=UPI000478E695|nr:hypothetical protein [Dyadobacter alkalitolerans]